MSASLLLVPHAERSSRPDISWIKKNVPILAVGRELGLLINNRWTKCWRPDNHKNGDTHPSLHFWEKGNRVRCFVCDPVRGHSCVDLVMGVLQVRVGEAVRWIAERFPVPNVKVGRPGGNALASPMPYRVGVRGSDWEVIVRSGMWGVMSAAEGRILMVLDYFKDPESGLTRISYRAMMRYSGIKKPANVSSAIKELCRMHALQSVPGLRCGLVRECSTYHVTLTDPKFLEICKRNLHLRPKGNCPGARVPRFPKGKASKGHPQAKQTIPATHYSKHE